MSDCGDECPFLNIMDHRCAQCLSLQSLDYAFEYCLDEYRACGIYVDMILERQLRRAVELNHAAAKVQIILPDRHEKSAA